MVDDILNKATLDADDIQQILGIGRKQTYELIHSGAFYSLKIGRRIKVPTKSFVKWFYGEN